MELSVEIILLLIGGIPPSSIQNSEATDIRRTFIKLETEKENNNEKRGNFLDVQNVEIRL